MKDHKDSRVLRETCLLYLYINRELTRVPMLNRKRFDKCSHNTWLQCVEQRDQWASLVRQAQKARLVLKDQKANRESKANLVHLAPEDYKALLEDWDDVVTQAETEREDQQVHPGPKANRAIQGYLVCRVTRVNGETPACKEKQVHPVKTDHRVTTGLPDQRGSLENWGPEDLWDREGFQD